MCLPKTKLFVMCHHGYQRSPSLTYFFLRALGRSPRVAQEEVRLARRSARKTHACNSFQIKKKEWCRRGESEYSGALKPRKLLVFRDAKNAERGRIGANWNVSGTRDFHFSCQFCGVAGWAALRSSSISARTGSGAADNTRSLSSYPVARTRLLGALPAVSSHCRLHLGTLNLRGIYCSSSSRCLSSNSGSANA